MSPEAERGAHSACSAPEDGRGALPASLRRVCVGSASAPKVEAVRLALGAYLPGVAVEGRSVESGVPDQPVGFEEIVRGARNRARAALTAARSDQGRCDLGVGIEDGLVELEGAPGGPFNLGCAALTDGRRESLGFSSGFAYPPACSRKALGERAPIGDLFDRLWESRRGERAAEPSGRSIGNIGKLSLGALPRAEYARHAVLCALLPLLHPDLYAEPEASP